MKQLFSGRKTLYFILLMTLVCIFTLTVVYAALNTVLKITGNAEVSSASWDIYLDNVVLNSGSSTTNVPTITNKTTASFTTTLTNPGDYYEFTIDVVNSGTIDAMIDSIDKLPQLSETQAKYLSYTVEYQNGEVISSKQLVEANSFVRLKVKVEYRKDLVASDLPNTSETLNLSFTLNYVQSDDSDNNVSIDNDGKLIKVVSGDGTKTSDEVCIGSECFYVMYGDEDTVTMLAKYNLLVGNKYDGSTVTALENPTGLQDETAIGWFIGYSANNPQIGTNSFSSTNYWSNSISTYPAYVYDENSYFYEYIENYKKYLITLGVVPSNARLITIEELEGLGCSKSSKSCRSGPSWVYGTTYWSGTSNSSIDIWYVDSNGGFCLSQCYNDTLGVRPVIVIDRDLL